MRKNAGWLWSWMVLLAFAPVGAGASAGRGGEAGNGGDSYSAEFVTAAQDAVSRLRVFPIANLDPAAVQSLIDRAQVTSQDNLTLNGRPVDAINYPDSDKPRIVVSRSGWDRIAAYPNERIKLAFHEYLGLLRFDDSKYVISKLLDQAHACERSPGIRKALETATHLRCDRILPEDLTVLTAIPNMASDRHGIHFGATSVYTDQLQPGDLSMLYALLGLNLEGAFASFPSGLFVDLKSIESLSFGNSSSRYPSLPAGTFDGLEKIRSLRIGDGAGTLKSIEPGAFAALHQVENLYIDPVNLDVLRPGTFAGLESVTHLELYSGRIGVVEAGAFAGLPKLNGLSLFQTESGEVRPGAFAGLEKLNSFISFRIGRATAEVFEPLRDVPQVQFALDFSTDELPADLLSAFRGKSSLTIEMFSPEKMPDGLFDGLAYVKFFDGGGFDFRMPKSLMDRLNRRYDCGMAPGGAYACRPKAP